MVLKLVSPYACDYLGKNLDDIRDDEFQSCPGNGCAQCDWCVDDKIGGTYENNCRYSGIG